MEKYERSNEQQKRAKKERRRREQQRDLKRKPLVGRRGYVGRPADRRQPKAKSPHHPHTVKLRTRDEREERGIEERHPAWEKGKKKEKKEEKCRRELQSQKVKDNRMKSVSEGKKEGYDGKE